MYVAGHLWRAERLESTNTRLDLADDYEMLLWNCVHVATHYFNAALHAARVTEERDDYPASEANYYYVRGGANNGWKVTWAPFGDLVHSHIPGSSVPALPTEPEGDLALILTDLRQIESYRARFVRGNQPYHVSDGVSCLDACERIKNLIRKLIDNAEGRSG